MEVLIGAYNWESSAFTTTFFPADLPAEWRLPYYANQFNALWIGERNFFQSLTTNWRQIFEDVPDRFLFVIETREGDSKVVESEKIAGYCTRRDDLTTAIATSIIESPTQTKQIILFWRPEIDSNIRLIRDQVEYWYSSEKSPDRLFIFVDSDQNVAKYLHDLRILLELMGY